MTIGAGIAIAGIWLGIGIVSRARSINGLGTAVCCFLAALATMVIGGQP